MDGFVFAGGRESLIDQYDRPHDEGETNAGNQGASFRDPFDGPELGLHWQCEGVEPSARFRPGNHELVAEAASEEEKSSPALYMAGHKRYSAEVEIIVEGPAEGRLLLYYNDAAYLGMGVNEHGVRHFRSFKGYGTMQNHTRRAFCGWLTMRISFHSITASMGWNGSGMTKWQMFQDSITTRLAGFRASASGLDAVGKGTVIFRDFSYNVIIS